MEELWTPWRMRYILRCQHEESCIFCEASKEDSTEYLILHRGRTVYVLLNLYPYTIGHLMVIPYRHLSRFRYLSDEEREETALRLRQSEAILRRVAGARRFHMGINLGRPAGAGVDGHLHAHLVPRDTTAAFSGSGTEPGEPPIPCEETHRRLLPHFSSLD